MVWEKLEPIQEIQHCTTSPLSSQLYTLEAIKNQDSCLCPTLAFFTWNEKLISIQGKIPSVEGKIFRLLCAISVLTAYNGPNNIENLTTKPIFEIEDHTVIKLELKLPM